MLASVTMCNDDISNYNSKISGFGPLTPPSTLKMKRPASNWGGIRKMNMTLE